MKQYELLCLQSVCVCVCMCVCCTPRAPHVSSLKLLRKNSKHQVSVKCQCNSKLQQPVSTRFTFCPACRRLQSLELWYFLSGDRKLTNQSTVTADDVASLLLSKKSNIIYGQLQESIEVSSIFLLLYYWRFCCLWWVRKNANWELASKLATNTESSTLTEYMYLNTH